MNSVRGRGKGKGQVSPRGADKERPGDERNPKESFMGISQLETTASLQGVMRGQNSQRKRRWTTWEPGGRSRGEYGPRTPASGRGAREDCLPDETRRTECPYLLSGPLLLRTRTDHKLLVTTPPSFSLQPLTYSLRGKVAVGWSNGASRINER